MRPRSARDAALGAGRAGNANRPALPGGWSNGGSVVPVARDTYDQLQFAAEPLYVIVGGVSVAADAT